MRQGPDVLRKEKGGGEVCGCVVGQVARLKQSVERLQGALPGDAKTTLRDHIRRSFSSSALPSALPHFPSPDDCHHRVPVWSLMLVTAHRRGALCRVVSGMRSVRGRREVADVRGGGRADIWSGR